MNYTIIDPTTGEDKILTNEKIADFLFQHLDQFGDKKDFILKCLAYVFQPGRGGFIVVGHEVG